MKTKFFQAVVLLVLFITISYSQYSNNIFTAIENNDIKAVNQLIMKNRNVVNTMDPTKGTPLHLAVRQGYYNLIKLLIRNRADINAKDMYGWTPLHEAAQEGNIDMVKMLISARNINAKNNDGKTPLHKTAMRGSKAVVDLLLKKGAEINALDYQGYTPLHIAIMENNLPIAEALLLKKAKSDLTDKNGNTPLHLAAMSAKKNNTGMFEYLLSKGANIYKKNNADKRPLELIKDADIKAKYKLYTSLHESAYDNNIKSAEMNIEKGLDIEAKDCFGNTPLHVASMFNNKEMVEMLLSKGANVYTKNNADETPIEVTYNAEISSLIKNWEKSYEAKLNLKFKELSNLSTKLKKKKIEIQETKIAFEKKFNNLIDEITRELKDNKITSFTEAEKNEKITYNLNLIQDKYAYIDYLTQEEGKITSDINQLDYLIGKTSDEITLIKTLGEDKLINLLSEINRAITEYGPRAGELMIGTKDIEKKPIKEIWEKFIQNKINQY
jgi:ankyrin repeat protein